MGGVLPEEKLRGREVWRSLVFLVGLPYLRAKAQDYYEALGGGIDRSLIEEGTESSGQRASIESVGTLFRGVRRHAHHTLGDRNSKVAANIQERISMG